MMKGQYHDRLFLSWLGRSLAVCAAVLALMVVSGTARADVGMPPPSSVISNAPTGSNVPFVVGKDGNVLRVPQDSYDRIINKSSKAQFESASRASGGTSELTTARKTINASFRDTHGASTSGTVRTTTQLPPISNMAKGLGALMIANIAVNHLNNLKQAGTADQFVRGMENGDWVMVAGAVGQLFDWTGAGFALNNPGVNNPAVTNPLYQQSLADARHLYDKYQSSRERINPDDYAQYFTVTVNKDHPNNADRSASSFLIKNLSAKPIGGSHGWFYSFNQGQTFTYDFATGAFGSKSATSVTYTFPAGNVFVLFKVQKSTRADIDTHNKGAAPTIDQVLPGEAAIIDLLTRLLNDTNRNNTALINAIWGSGVANGGNTTTTVDNSTTNNNTFLTSPYTPAGSNTPQQTQFKVNKDGSVTATTVPRPDLAPNSSQAPISALKIPTQQCAQTLAMPIMKTPLFPNTNSALTSSLRTSSTQTANALSQRKSVW